MHRTVWEYFRGPIPDGLELDHIESCLRILCCNPDCLDPVTRAENERRKALRRQHCRNGHEYTPENTRTTRGQRECRRCHADTERERQRKQRADRQARYAKVCARGHVRTPENTWVRATSVTCKDCMSESAKARATREGGVGHHTRLRRKSAESGSGSKPE